MDRDFLVRNTHGNLKLIPYIGCKSGFSHIFDALIPDNYGHKIYDVFGGGGASRYTPAPGLAPETSYTTTTIL